MQLLIIALNKYKKKNWIMILKRKFLEQVKMNMKTILIVKMMLDINNHNEIKYGKKLKYRNTSHRIANILSNFLFKYYNTNLIKNIIIIYFSKIKKHSNLTNP